MMQALQDTAEQALALMRAQGFEHAQVDAVVTAQDELNIAHNEPSLLRSTATRRLALLGIVDGRKASTEMSDFAPEQVQERIAGLLADARSAPRDDANAVSAGQAAHIVQGPQESNSALLAEKVAELLEFRAQQTPKMQLEEGAAAHSLVQRCCVTSGGSRLLSSVGCYSLTVMGSAREGSQVSSFNYCGGNTNDLRLHNASDFFAIGDMMRASQRQIVAAPIGERFTGSVVLTPNAVNDLVEWLLEQIADNHLIGGSSLYMDRVGQRIGSALLTLKSRFDAPGVAAVSADGFAAQPVEIVRNGTLVALTPTLYASRKTGIAHVPLAASGWEMAAGDAPREQLVAAVQRGALIDRLSMGNPAPNGDFSGVIKNSFVIEAGRVGGALSETMISGNIAQMLHDVVAVSRERIDTGGWVLPSLQIEGLHFS
ncbi:MAG TPA: metallopeptidase TldD-related protein, partial [Rubrivivax sp.]|nr:metallopeptidase TldD-related protein [Rubrivivax sp.]